jgi:putative endonuclease
MKKNGVYILLCANNRYYIGSTNDLERRFNEHNKGFVKATKYLLPVKFVFFQELSDLKQARGLELKLKKFKSRKIIEQIIKDGFIKIV